MGRHRVPVDVHKKTGHIGKGPYIPSMTKLPPGTGRHTASPAQTVQDISFLRPKKPILDLRAGLLTWDHRAARLLDRQGQWRIACRSPLQQRSCRGFAPRSLLIRRKPEPANFPLFSFRHYDTTISPVCKAPEQKLSRLTYYRGYSSASPRPASSLREGA